ncbi:unnamed protein product [Malus baccata var. baccata]
MKDVKRCHTRVQIGCDDWNTTLESPIDRNIENDIVSIPNPSQRILTPTAGHKYQCWSEGLICMNGGILKQQSYN